MASMSNMPYVIGYIMSLCSCHFNNAIFSLKKINTESF